MLSTHVVAGTEVPRTIRLRALIDNQVMLLRLDSGSTNNFICTAFAKRIAVKAVPMPVVDGCVANGERLVCNNMAVKKIEKKFDGVMYITVG